VDTETYIVINAKNGEIVTANRDEDLAIELSERLYSFDSGCYYVREVTLH
jgi:hypothetical protein